jgi:hypothetical protein
MMVPSEADAFKYALCMELRQDSFRYAFIEPKSKAVVFLQVVDFESVDKEGLTELLNEDYFKFDFQSVSITVSTPRQTLVPNAIFNASNSKDIFALNHMAPIDNLDYRRLPELGMVCIYEMPLWIKAVFIKHFLRAKINHTATVLLKGIFSSNHFKPKAYLLKETNLFYLVMTNKNKLTYFNVFESTEVADMVYYYLYTMEQNGFSQEDAALTIFGLGEGDAAYKELCNLLSAKIELPATEQQQAQFILTNSLLCV